MHRVELRGQLHALGDPPVAAHVAQHPAAAAPGWPSTWLNAAFWARRPKTTHQRQHAEDHRERDAGEQRDPGQHGDQEDHRGGADERQRHPQRQLPVPRGRQLVGLDDLLDRLGPRGAFAFAAFAFGSALPRGAVARSFAML